MKAPNIDFDIQGRRPTTRAASTAAFGRLLIAILFLLSGLGKLARPTFTIGYIASAHLPFPSFAYGVALLVELGGGILLLLGFRARATAAVLAAFTVVAALGFHNNFADPNQMIHFLKNIAIAGGLLQVVAFGAGAFSLDGRREAQAGRT
ncbi:LysR family transcriptional regulator [Sphingobium yanoikuyae]|uniref:LysR family transcriptional regulator n=1 Tax=Sphingobium yanoikuyae TaxID=13690 RepID=A0A177JTX5_SPHYA|nr:DoxX family protein [Sphingobium yanoikuyae]OAH44689.1 LysR family transcriptional regulator [Sphingobium yanoikuyae]